MIRRRRRGPRALVVWLVVWLVGTLVGTQAAAQSAEQSVAQSAEQSAGPSPGGWFNIPMQTSGGRQFWADEQIHCGWRIQRNVFTDHFRLLDPGDVRRAWGRFEACRKALDAAAREHGLRPRSDHLVVLVHGLGRSRHAMAELTAAVEAAGFQAAAVGYPSTRGDVAAHAEQLARVLNRCEGVRTVSFVTHSMGGLVVRALLGRDAPWRRRLALGRLVMIGPPNRGSALATRMDGWMPFDALAGEVGGDLTVDAVAKLPVPPLPFAVIAGGTGKPLGYNPLIPGDDDGIVAVANTRLAGMAGFLRLKTIHNRLKRHPRALEATVAFLRVGRLQVGPV